MSVTDPPEPFWTWRRKGAVVVLVAVAAFCLWDQVEIYSHQRTMTCTVAFAQDVTMSPRSHRTEHLITTLDCGDLELRALPLVGLWDPQATIGAGLTPGDRVEFTLSGPRTSTPGARPVIRAARHVGSVPLDDAFLEALGTVSSS